MVLVYLECSNRKWTDQKYYSAKIYNRLSIIHEVFFENGQSWLHTIVQVKAPTRENNFTMWYQQQDQNISLLKKQVFGLNTRRTDWVQYQDLLDTLPETTKVTRYSQFTKVGLPHLILQINHIHNTLFWFLPLTFVLWYEVRHHNNICL